VCVVYGIARGNVYMLLLLKYSTFINIMYWYARFIHFIHRMDTYT